MSVDQLSLVFVQGSQLEWLEESTAPESENVLTMASEAKVWRFW